MSTAITGIRTVDVPVTDQDRAVEFYVSALPSGYPVGTAEDALDCTCGLYLNDPTARLPRRTSAHNH